MKDIFIEKAQIDTSAVNIFLILVVITFIIGILCIIFSKEKKWEFGIPLLIVPSIIFFITMMGNKEFENKLDGFIKTLFEVVYNGGYIVFTLLSFAIVIFIWVFSPLLGGKK